MRIYTIGFTGKTAQEFFEKLDLSDARYLLDVRIRNNSQLAGFTKKGNIEYFTEQLTPLTYLELPELAPTAEMFKQYREDKDWPAYETGYLNLLGERDLRNSLDGDMFAAGSVLLCTEPTPEMCHRRLAAEFLAARIFKSGSIVHL
ncbi:MAG: DUF488 domain-containing protein [Chloroflexi bacterium]|nr:DUF488 domain-containing protein [Chloroflexota bacterium]